MDGLGLRVFGNYKILRRETGYRNSSRVTDLHVANDQVRGNPDNFVFVYRCVSSFGARLLDRGVFLLVPFQASKARAKVLQLWALVRQCLGGRTEGRQEQKSHDRNAVFAKHTCKKA